MRKLYRYIAKVEDKKVFGLAILSRSSIDFFTILIIISALLMGFELVYPNQILPFIQRIILYIFLFEIILRGIIAKEHKEFNRHLFDPWTIFDIIVVGAGFIPSSFQKISNILRIFRVFRIFRVIKAFPNIKIIVSIILRCIPRMGTIGILLLLLMYVYSIIGIEMFGKVQTSFSSFQHAFFTLFVELTGDWVHIRNEAVAHFGFWSPTIFHVSWILLSYFLVLNLFIGVILDSFNSLRESEQMKKKFLKLDLVKPYTLVLGWNEDIKLLIKNFIEGNRSLTRSTMVIMARKEFEEMENYLQYSVYTELEGKKIFTDIITRKGDSSNAYDLSLVINEQCQSIILLPDQSILRKEEDQFEHDLKVIESLTSLSAFLSKEQITIHSIITTFYESIPLSFPQSLNIKNVRYFNPSKLSGKILNQLSLSKNSYSVIEELFSYDGCELYTNTVTKKRGLNNISVVGKKVSDLEGRFYPSILLGWKEYATDKIYFCNHKTDKNYKLQEKDTLIILAEDDSVIKLNHWKYDITKKLSFCYKPSEEITSEIKAYHILIMGWGSLTREYIRALNASKENIRITLAIDNEKFRNEIDDFWKAIELQLAEVKIFTEIDDCFALLQEYNTLGKFFTTITLVSSEIFKAETDIRDIMSILKGRDIAIQSKTPLRFIAEVNYEKYIPTIKMLGLKDIMFPNHFTMGYLSLLCEDDTRLEIYNKILEYHDTNIFILTPEEYQKKKEQYILIGFYLKKANEKGKRVILCPDISLQKFSDEDRVIVFA